MAEIEEIQFNEKTYDEVFDKYGFCRFYKYHNKVYLTYFCAPKYCSYKSIDFDPAYPDAAYNCLYALYCAYCGVTGERKQLLLEDPCFQYVIHKSNCFVAEYYDDVFLSKINDPVLKNSLINLLANMRKDLKLPSEITEEEKDRIAELTQQTYKEMDRQMEHPEKIPNTQKLLDEASEIQKVNQRYNDLQPKIKRGTL